MKILCVIDSFGSGGAQRQMIGLAIGLKKRGHNVELFNYFPHLDFYRNDIINAGVVIHDCYKKSKFSFTPIFSLFNLLKNKNFDVAVSFLTVPNIFLELAHLLTWKTKIIVSERSSVQGTNTIPFHRLLYASSSHIVVNSRSHYRWLLHNHSEIKKKLKVIYNGVDLDKFKFSKPRIKVKKHLKFLTIGRVGYEKNFLNVVRAFIIFKKKNGWLPSLDLVGREDESTKGAKYLKEVRDLLDENPEVKSKIKILGPRKDVNLLIPKYDAVLHPSLYEGLPNAICESLASGRLVLASDVCDNGVLIEEGKRGFLFEPKSPASIQNAIHRFSILDQVTYEEMCLNSRSFAEEYLSMDRMIGRYEKLFFSCITYRTNYRF